MDTNKISYWHGGVPGLSVGQEIRPAIERPLPVAYINREYDTDPKKIFITTDKDLAASFASQWFDMKSKKTGGGTLYRVKPAGLLEVDPDFAHVPGLSYTCDFAVIEKVEKRKIFESFELRLHAEKHATWADGRKIYDEKGYMQPSPELEAKGITAAQLRAFGRLPDLDTVGAWVLRNYK
ncbi:hypothetical protein [Glutamicibacter nicotianae]|uniref:hypothetical protein n=1 Tax=Glutamicibacter nicotianae TaxID=37929 RepID=UPI000EF94A35|nr:hypothetical protein [Glutamicibacter nicotianae]